MGLDFLLQYGGRRLRQYIQPPPLENNTEESQDEQKDKVDLQIETRSLDGWEPISVDAAPLDPALIPGRFVDGCLYGGIVTCLWDAHRHPIPVRLAEIGGVCMWIDGRSLRRQFAYVERIVCFIIDPFPWHEVEDFAAALAKIDMRLVPAKLPKIGGERKLTHDYAIMQQQTYTRAEDEMRVLEGLALDQDQKTLTLVDGPLARINHPQAIGVIKQHRKSYLHAKGWQVFYELKPGQRTPAFQLTTQSTPLVSWYLRLDGENGTMPNWGIIRVEITRAHFERQGSDEDRSGYLNRLSNALRQLRCRQASYARAPVSMEPIVRAEDSLKSLLISPATLAQQFYRLTGL